jgi:phage baseplate assembly protein W
MAIKINSLKIDKLSDKALKSDYLYKDLALDLSQDVSYNNQLNKTETLRDVRAIYDIESVKNSIATAFLTSPGDKILNPTYGVDLRQFIFEPIDDFTSEIIQDLIETQLPIMEPRVILSDVSVIGNEDINQYDISMKIDVPSLNIYGVSIKSQLNSVGYTIL